MSTAFLLSSLCLDVSGSCPALQPDSPWLTLLSLFHSGSVSCSLVSTPLIPKLEQEQSCPENVGRGDGGIYVKSTLLGEL